MTGALGLAPASRLRAYGTWAEGAYVYGHNGAEAIAVKRLTWTMPVGLHDGQPWTLVYYADAVVDPKRMNDLAYLAEREGAAVEQLDLLVQLAAQGIAYLGLPHPVAEISRDVVALVGQWVESRGHPEGWAQELARTIETSITRLNAYHALVQGAGAVVDPEHPTWGLKVAIRPLEVADSTEGA